MANARLTVRLDKSLRSRLALVARSAGRRESQLVRDALEEYLSRQLPVKSCYDVFKEAGAIGCYQGGPPDLSTNPKYMEGFGRD